MEAVPGMQIKLGNGSLSLALERRFQSLSQSTPLDPRKARPVPSRPLFAFASTSLPLATDLEPGKGCIVGEPRSAAKVRAAAYPLTVHVSSANEHQDRN